MHGDIVYLTVSGLGTDAGSYTARVAEDAAGENYILTNLEYGYEIAKAVVNVTWSVADYYIDNDEVQGPHAYIVNESGEMIELSILNLGTESGEYVAEIDLSSVNPNFELSGELQKSYEIIPEKAFGNGGIAMSVVLGAILLVIVILFMYLYWNKRIKGDRGGKNGIKPILSKSKKQSEENIEEAEDTCRHGKTQKQPENNSKGTSEPKVPDSFMPIEYYFKSIDEAYGEASSCRFDPENPEKSYNIQNEALNKIIRLLAVYRSQRR